MTTKAAGLTEEGPIDLVDWANWAPKDQATLTFVIDRGPSRRVLLMRKKRGLGAGKINAPGGRLEPGETLAACAAREVEEELGVTPSGPRLVGRLSFQFEDGYSIQPSVFVATEWSGEAVETEEAAPLWTPLDRIPYEEMWEDDHLWVPWALAERHFEGWFRFDGDRMVAYRLRVAAGLGPTG